MIVNGFNSNDYRYFRNKETGTITKYSSESLERHLFSDNYKNRLKEYINPYTIKPYPKDKPFDLLEFIRMQNPIVFKVESYLSVSFDTKDFFMVTRWLNNKMNSQKITNLFLGYTIKVLNQEIFQKLWEGERIEIVKNSLEMNEKQEMQSIRTSLHTIQKLFQFKGPISGFKIPFSKDEVWHLVNPAVSFLLLNQQFIRDTYASEEILGEEKEMLFYEEYKDNIPHTTIRYYELKEDVFVTKIHDLDDELSLEDFHHGYESIILRMFGDLLFCKENICNYRNDFTVKRIAIKYYENIYDRRVETEILKIANRISLEEALLYYQEDQKVYQEVEKRKEAEELIFKYPRKFHKSHLSPEDFLCKERIQAEFNLIRVLKNISSKKSI